MNKAKAMLDALMGPSRDISAKERKDDWKERTVCKKFLVGFCPYDKAVLGGRRGFEPCAKIHNEILRAAFNEHDDGAPDSSFRRDCEDVALRDLTDVLAEKDAYAKKQLEAKRAEQKCRRLSDDVNAKILQMRREAKIMTEKAATLEDCDGRLKDQLEKDAAALTTEMEAYLKDEERKAQLAAPKAESCEECGTAYVGDAEYKAHLEYKAHGSYIHVREKVEELRKNKEEWAQKKQETFAEERKKKMEEDIKKEEERAAKKKKDKGAQSDDEGNKSNGGDRSKSMGTKRSKSRGDDKRKRSRSKRDDKRSRSKGNDKRKRSRSKGDDKRSKSRGGDKQTRKDKDDDRRRRKDRSQSRGGGNGITRVSAKDREEWDRSKSPARDKKRNVGSKSTGRRKSPSRSRSRKPKRGGRSRSRSRSRGRRR